MCPEENRGSEDLEIITTDLHRIKQNFTHTQRHVYWGNCFLGIVVPITGFNFFQSAVTDLHLLADVISSHFELISKQNVVKRKSLKIWC